MPVSTDIPKEFKAESKFWKICKIAIAAVLIYVVFSHTDFEAIYALRNRLSPPWLCAGIFAFACNLWFSAKRSWVLIRSKIPFRDFIPVFVLQTAVSNFVAGSAGAVSYVALLRKEHEIRIHEGILSLLASKIGDMFAMLLTLLISTVMVWDQITPVRWLACAVLAFITGVIVVFVLIIIFRRHLSNLLYIVSRRTRIARHPFMHPIFNSIHEIAQKDIRNFYPSLSSVTVYSLLTMGSLILWGFSNVAMFAVPIGLWPVIFMTSLTQILSIIPIHVFGGLGVYDLTVLYLYSLFGFEPSDIAPMIIGLRLLFYLFNMPLVAYLSAAMFLGKKNRL